jgi:hypothetical protein
MANVSKFKRRLRNRVVYKDEASEQEVPEREITDVEE